MNDCTKTKRRLFSIFEKAKRCDNYNEISHSSQVKKQKFKIKQTPKIKSTRLKAELCVERILPDSPNDLEKNNLQNMKLTYAPQKKNTKISKSNSFTERIDKYFNIQPSTASNEQQPEVRNYIALGTEGGGMQEIDETENSTALYDGDDIKDDDDIEFSDSFIDTIDTNAIVDMINNTEIFEGESQKQNENSNSVSFDTKKTVESNLKNQTGITKINTDVNLTNSSQNKNCIRQPQKITNKFKNGKKVIEELSTKTGRPPPTKSRKVAEKKQAKTRIKKINVAKTPKNTYGKFSEDKLNSVNIRKIPKKFLDETLDMLQNEDHLVWKDRNISCNAGIHRYWEKRSMISDQNMKMEYARQFLLRREWLYLSKVLCLFNRDGKTNIYYPLLVKYAALCLAHTDKEQFEKFVKSLLNLTDNSVIKKCTQISRQS